MSHLCGICILLRNKGNWLCSKIYLLMINARIWQPSLVKSELVSCGAWDVATDTENRYKIHENQEDVYAKSRIAIAIF